MKLIKYSDKQLCCDNICMIKTLLLYQAEITNYCSSWFNAIKKSGRKGKTKAKRRWQMVSWSPLCFVYTVFMGLGGVCECKCGVWGHEEKLGVHPTVLVVQIMLIINFFISFALLFCQQVILNLHMRTHTNTLVFQFSHQLASLELVGVLTAQWSHHKPPCGP